MIYLDSSSFLKLFLNEPETVAVQTALEAEEEVVVSTLTQLETESQLRGALLGGRLTKPQHRKIAAAYESILGSAPFVVKSLAGTLFATALRVHHERPELHCRSLDRLQLAAMSELAIKRLMCHDVRLCTVAMALGFEVLTPK